MLQLNHTVIISHVSIEAVCYYRRKWLHAFILMRMLI